MFAALELQQRATRTRAEVKTIGLKNERKEIRKLV